MPENLTETPVIFRKERNKETAMNDWYELPAGRELDKIIAQQLGYTIQRVEWIANATTGEMDYMYALTDPSGKRNRFGGKDIEAVWRSDHCFHEVYVPHFSTNLDDACTLPLGDYYLYIANLGKQSEARIVNPDVDALGEFDTWIGEAEVNEPALAVCRAWLKWKECVDNPE
jgi:hypothetical protein